MKLGLIIPYRDRKEHLDIFIPYITQHLESQNISYKIIVVEQCNKNPFNRSKLMNIGAKYIYDEVDYLCFHDVDLIPEKSVSYKINNEKVIHLVGYLIKNRDNVVTNSMINYGMSFDEYFKKYKSTNYTKTTYIGGVTLFKKEIWKNNKFNEIYQGWGKEDDDIYWRLAKYSNINITKTENRYISLNHKSNNKIFKILKYNFNTLDYYSNYYILHELIDQYIKKNVNQDLIKFDTKYDICELDVKQKYKKIKVNFKYDKYIKFKAFHIYINKIYLFRKIKNKYYKYFSYYNFITLMLYLILLISLKLNININLK